MEAIRDTEVQTHLGEILDRVERGEQIAIVRDGKHVAVVGPPAASALHDSPSPQDTRPIWETIAAIGRDVADSEWEKVPTDLARNLDHYLYGDHKE